MMGSRSRYLGAGPVLCVLAAAACGDTTGPDGVDQVEVRFAAVSSAAATQDGSLEVTGSNGTLRIDEMHMIVAEFELKRTDDAACVGDDDDDDCEKFEAPPSFLDVPLDGSGVIAVRQMVPAGTYRELEFEVEDLDDDEDNPVEAQQIAELRAQIRAQFPDWPDDASMLLVGSFTPTGGDPIPFRVYFEAEIEVELDLIPPVVIGAGGGEPVFTVRIDPELLVRNSDGTVRNLAEIDFDATGRVIEFEIEIENSITEIEFDD